jgi:RHS repeat-associated protein
MPTKNRTHTYDVLQRLKTGGTTDNAETYDYDLVGNRTTSFLSSTHNHDDLNRLLEDDSFTYTYDNNGNLATKTNKANPTEVTTYHWDAQDQLIQIDRPNSTTVTYKYDGLGRRIEKNVVGTLTRYVYDGEDILLEYDGPANTFVARYSHGDQVDQPLVLQKAGQGFFYYHSNHQGSITHLTDSSGTVANSYVYDSYGRRLAVAESVIQSYSYTGREFDVESGLYFYRARYHDATTGRFLSEDPFGFAGQDPNLYRYVGNNPINFNDPSGKYAIAICRFVCPPALEALRQLGREVLNAAAKAAAAALASQAAGDAANDAQDESSANLPGSGESCDVEDQRNNPEKEALVDMAKKDKRKGISEGDMEAYKELNKDLSDPFPDDQVRGPETHPKRNFNKPHGHVGAVDHIPVK